MGAKTAYIEPGSPWENGYCESFNARFRDELINGELFYSLREAQVLIERWRKHYNMDRPHSALAFNPDHSMGSAHWRQAGLNIIYIISILRHRTVADRLSIHCVVLMARDEGLHVGRWDQPHLMAQLANLAAPIMSATAGLHRHDTSRQLVEEPQNLPRRSFLRKIA